MIPFGQSLCEHGPTISPLYCPLDVKVAVDYYAINVVVPQKSLYKSIQQLRSVSYLPHAFLWKHLPPLISFLLAAIYS